MSVVGRCLVVWKGEVGNTFLVAERTVLIGQVSQTRVRQR